MIKTKKEILKLMAENADDNFKLLVIYFDVLNRKTSSYSAELNF